MDFRCDGCFFFGVVGGYRFYFKEEGFFSMRRVLGFVVFGDIIMLVGGFVGYGEIALYYRDNNN